MLVEVTAEDIANGTRASCANCPVARAVHRALGSPANVGLFEIWANDPFRQVKTTRAVRKFICDFDDGKPVAPFSFDIDVPPASHAPTEPK